MDEIGAVEEIDGVNAVMSLRGRQPGPAGLRDAYEPMIAALREFQDAIARSAINASTARELRAQITAWSRRLDGSEVDDLERLWGHWFDVPGRCQALVPAIYDEQVRDMETTARVRFGRFYVGENLAVYGGAISLLMDELLGQLTSRARIAPSRTAYLTTTFRSVVPVDVELTTRVWLDREEGRKIFVRGELRHGDVLCAEANGLWVALKPGQP